MWFRSRLWLTVMATITTSGVASFCSADEGEPPTRLPEVEVYGLMEGEPFLPEVDGTRIYLGKKTSVVEIDELPDINNNNFRQAFSQLPGLLVSEMTIPSHANMNYRAIGDPHEAESLLTLKDGIPIVSDWFGYSTLYYTPPLESVERVEFVRGGSSLLYGPQPGPALNYVTYQPPQDRKFAASTQHILGSDDLYTTYSQAGGTLGQLGYLGYFHHRQGDGPRSNADFQVDTGSLKLVLEAAKDAHWTFAMDAYSSESGEPGRLSLAQYQSDRNFTRTPDDRIWVERYQPSLTYRNELSEDTELRITSWGGYQKRLSRRQTGAANTNVDLQEFYFGGLDARMRHDWDAWDNKHTLTGGLVFYASDSPRTRERGTPPSANSGAPVFDLDRHTYYGSVFAENAFKCGRLSIIPAVRLEFVSLNVRENFNTGVTRALIDDSFVDVVPLGAIGVTYDLGGQNLTYANVSQGYRPKKYDDLANPTSNSQLAPRNLTESRTWTYETGVRGTPSSWLQYDTSLFLVDYDDFIETRDLGGGNTERANSGRARYYGWEASVAVDLVGLYDQTAGTTYRTTLGGFTIHGNVSLLEAEFVSGINNGKEPAYAPGYMVKAGGIYRWKDRLKLSMTGQLVDDHFWLDNNTAGSVGTSKIAAYMVWDLAAEAKLHKDYVSVIAGVNNVFDEDYYSRIRNDGIDPAYHRTYYGGVKISIP